MKNKEKLIILFLVVIGAFSFIIFKNLSHGKDNNAPAFSVKKGNLSSITGEKLNVTKIEIDGVYENKKIEDSKKITLSNKDEINELLTEINKYTFEKDNGYNDDYNSYHPNEFIKRTDDIKSIRIYFNISSKTSNYAIGIVSVDNKSALVLGIDKKSANYSNSLEGGYHLLDSGLYNYIIQKYFS